LQKVYWNLNSRSH